jgi:6-phosphogluconate dehydrogenase
MQVPVPTIDQAVAMRDLSKYKGLRDRMEKAYRNPVSDAIPVKVDDLEQALFFSFILCYAQGLHMLIVASNELNYSLDLASIAKIWRGGCIIRASLLEDIYSAFSTEPTLDHLLLSPGIRELLAQSENGMRLTASLACQSGVGAPALTSALGYYDMLRTSQMPTNLIQAQRDFFGSHTYERTDQEGIFHTDW